MKISKLATEITTALLALLFFYAAISKLIDFETFRFQLGRSPYIGKIAGLLAIALLVAEFTIVGLLYFGTTRLAGLWAAFISMLIFTVYISMMLLSGLHLPCSCAGLISKLSWSQHLVFNILFTLISLAGIIFYKRQGKEYRDNNYKLLVS